MKLGWLAGDMALYNSEATPAGNGELGPGDTGANKHGGGERLKLASSKQINTRSAYQRCLCTGFYKHPRLWKQIMPNIRTLY